MNKILDELEITRILKFDEKTNLVKTHESKTIEFKESFNFNSKKDYFRTMAAFANASGGYIIFGVKDKPRKLVGLDSERIKMFDEMKIEEFTMDLNNFFSPEIIWDYRVININSDISLGVIYVYEADIKPIICKKRYDSKNNKGSTIEGEIYYRYNGKNGRIQYNELLKIINHEKEKENKKWLSFFSKVSKIGIDNAGLLDINSGIFSAGNNSIIIDKKMLSNIKFIKEGEFNERKGIPTLNVIGNVELKQGELLISPEKIKVKGIRFSDIIIDFLEQKKIKSPVDYITQICHENTSYLPVYYYIKMSNKTIEEIIEIIEKELIRSQAKTVLLKRIRTGKIDLENLKNESKKTIYCKDIIEHIKMADNDYIEEKYDIYKIMTAIRAMNKKEILKYKDYLLGIMNSYYIKYYQIDGKFAMSFRKTICWIDEALFM